MMRRGLNAGFGEPIAHELPSLIRLGVKAIRQDLTLAKIPLRDLIAEFDDCIIEPLWLINPNQIEQVPDGSAIELVNEPNLTGWSVDAYADAVRVCLPKARLHNLTMYVVGISNTGVREQQYLAGLLQRVPEITHVSVHRYPAKSMASYDGHSGFRTRADETKALLRLIGERPYIVTEFGDTVQIMRAVEMKRGASPPRLRRYDPSHNTTPRGTLDIRVDGTGSIVDSPLVDLSVPPTTLRAPPRRKLNNPLTRCNTDASVRIGSFLRRDFIA